MRTDALTTYLSKSTSPHIVMTFEEIESVAGEPLQAGARSNRTFWANSARNTYARAWMDAGYLATSNDVPSGSVAFVSARLGAAPDVGASVLTVSDIAEALTAYLESEGWTVAAPASGSSDSDLRAEKDGESLELHLKGQVSSTPQQRARFITALGELVQTMEAADTRYGIALADDDSNRSLVAGLSAAARANVVHEVFLVSRSGTEYKVASA